MWRGGAVCLPPARPSFWEVPHLGFMEAGSKAGEGCWELHCPLLPIDGAGTRHGLVKMQSWGMCSSVGSSKPAASLGMLLASKCSFPDFFFSLFTVRFLRNSDFLLITASVCLLFPCVYLGQKERALRWRNTFLSQAIHKFFLFYYISLPLCMCMLKFPFPVYKCLAAEVTGVFHSITFARLRT